MWTSSKPVSSAAALLLPLLAMAGIVGSEAGPRPGAADFTLRCWQDGRLILEEQHVRLPPGLEGASTRLQVIDRHHQPVIVAETKNATCLVKARPPERPRSALP